MYPVLEFSVALRSSATDGSVGDRKVRYSRSEVGHRGV